MESCKPMSTPVETLMNCVKNLHQKPHIRSNRFNGHAI
jgi:hypothetical protein